MVICIVALPASPGERKAGKDGYKKEELSAINQ